MNSPNALRDLCTVLKHLASGERWQQESDQFVQVRRSLAQIIPASLAKGCEAWLGDDGILVLVCANGAVAGKLRHLAPRIMHHFRAPNFQVRSIRVEVQAGLPGRSPAAAKPARTLSAPAAAAADLENLARQVGAPGLAAALLHLAARLRECAAPDQR